MENGYLTLGPFLSKYCDGKTDKLSGLFVIDDFQSKREEFARMSRPIDFISSNYKNLTEDDDFLEEDGAGYEISIKLLSDRFDKEYYISMCYPMIDDPETLKSIETLKGSPDEYKRKALEAADSYVVILSKIPLSTDLGIDTSSSEMAPSPNIESSIGGFLICDYVVFSTPASLKGNDDLTATGMALPIGIVETKEKAAEIAAKRLGQFTSVLEVKNGSVVIESMVLYFTGVDGKISVVSSKKEKGD